MYLNVKIKKIFTILTLLLSLINVCWAEVRLEALYPFNLEKKTVTEVKGQSTFPLYLDLFTHDVPKVQQANITVELPEDFKALSSAGWQISNEGRKASVEWSLPADFGRHFDLLYIQAGSNAVAGTKNIKLLAQGSDWRLEKNISFTYISVNNNKGIEDKHKATSDTAVAKQGKKVDKSKFNWYIQDVKLPVDKQGQADAKSIANVIYVRDTSLESFRNRMVGNGATNWSAVFAHPACHLLLDMRNPQMDVRMLKFKAEMLDKATGKPVPGLCTSGKVSEDGEEGWAGSNTVEAATTALISLDGKKAQTFILPIYVDYLNVLEGDYNLRITVSGNGQEKITELPLTITKKHNIGLAMVGFALLAFVIMLLFSKKIKDCIYLVGAKGAITIALFSAIAFGGITLPTTILGDFLHVFLGPFSGLITGLLSGVLLYLLIMSLLVLYRKPGVLALMYIVRFMLSGIMFGHFTPIGVLSCSVNIVILESVLYFSGFYRSKSLEHKYMLGIAILMGCADAAITFVNLEQLMFFYRLYYADWYLALYMIINGFMYSSIGAWLGYKTGAKLRQVMGE